MEYYALLFKTTLNIIYHISNIYIWNIIMMFSGKINVVSVVKPNRL